MKRIICAVLAAGLLAAGPLAASAKGGEKDGGRREGRAMEMLKDRLGLTDDQAAKLKAAWEAQKKAVKDLRQQSREETRKLEGEVRDLASNKDIQETLDQLDANRKSMADERQKLEAASASILKPYQRAKLRLLLARRMKHRGHWGRGGAEGRGGHESCGGGEKHGGWGGRDGGERGGNHDGGEAPWNHGGN
ncbi:MAG TPA: periplasmic heavy metal sensor [Elusimicrobiota bacterium]|nr:periplasmic heavy metal sensor [Elusimicrobiota bacterium]